MNAQELFLKDGASAKVWYCSECKIVAKNKEDADNCCKRNDCKYCGKIVERLHWLSHDECAESNRRKKTEKLDTWDGMVFYEGKYFSGVEDLLEHLEIMEEEIPDYVYVCKTDPFPKINIDHIIEKIKENSYENVMDSVAGLENLI